MKHDDPIVGGQAQIAFDARAQLERAGEGDEAILGKTGAVMQAPVRKPGGTGIERVSG